MGIVFINRSCKKDTKGNKHTFSSDKRLKHNTKVIHRNIEIYIGTAKNN